MKKYIILTQSEVGGRAITAWTRLLAIPDRETMVTCPIVFDERYHSTASGMALYEYFVEQIEDRISGQNREHVTVLVDSIRLVDLTLVGEATTWSNLTSMLIMTFPEFRWAFLNDEFPQDSEKQQKAIEKHTTHRNFEKSHLVEVLQCHGRLSPFKVWRDPTFDPTGLRNWVRIKTNENLEEMNKEGGNKHSPFQLPVRRPSAAVIEDEQDFASLHAYAAYRYGFRTELVTSWGLMEERFCEKVDVDGDSVLSSKNRHSYQLIFEDMRLQFADKPARIKLSNLESRGDHCNRLADENDRSTLRIMVSTGQEGMAVDDVSNNRAFLDSRTHGVGKLLIKPIGGPIDLWDKSGLSEELASREDAENPRGNAHGFVWPPAEIMDDLHSGHGTPGKLALVATTLLERARVQASSATTANEWIKVALLATDALELVGGKTPSLALDALRLKTSAEVRAECAFVGAGFHCDLKIRFKELNQELNAICRWYDESDRKRCFWDAKATILNEMIEIYRSTGQMEEEDKCLAEFRSVNRKLERPRGRQFFNPFAWAIHAVLAYAELLLASVWRIAFAFGAWIFVFAFAAWLNTGENNFFIYIAKQLNWMVGGGTQDVDITQLPTMTDEANATNLKLVGISIASNIIGVFHFGILMSYLYGLISRK